MQPSSRHALWRFSRDLAAYVLGVAGLRDDVKVDLAFRRATSAADVGAVVQVARFAVVPLVLLGWRLE